MTPKIRIYRSGELVCETEGIPGETLLRRIGVAGVFLDAPCGGKGLCGKCLVCLRPDGEQILACCTKVDGNMDVYLPDDMEMKIAVSGTAADRVESERSTLSAKKKKLGVAIDIGTTTVVAHLTDIETGVRIATASGVNAQRTYGADVISRIQYCAENGPETLTKIIREQLTSLICETCNASGLNALDIVYISIAANTIMQHLAAGYSPAGMGVVPFKPVSLFGDEHPAWDNLPTDKETKIFFAPAISSYVGGDITAGILASGLEDAPCPAIYLDIGTNGEVVMKTDDMFFCCATAAGPAFEGAGITMGMAAVSGAVNYVKWDRGLQIEVIGDGAPRGICGSGLIDSLSVLLETGAVNESGRLLDSDKIKHEVSQRIGKVNGRNAFWLVKADEINGMGVNISATDIRQLQLAKSSIAAGIQTLLHHAGITERQVKSFIIAGGFGSFMNKFSAARIGLFPKSFLPVASTHGNTAGEGAALALCSETARTALEGIRKRCEYIELSTNKVFNEQFVEQMTFED